MEYYEIGLSHLKKIYKLYWLTVPDREYNSTFSNYLHIMFLTNLMCRSEGVISQLITGSSYWL